MNKKRLKITASIAPNGIKIYANNRHYKLEYPPGIWKSFPQNLKEVFLDNIVYLLTVDIPLVSSFNAIEYNTSMPFFKPFFDTMVIDNIPSAIEDYSDSTLEVIKKFINTKYIFKNRNIKIPPRRENRFRKKAIIPLSCGKDSLLTLGISKEIGIDPVCVYINDTVSPSENRIKIKHCLEISKRFDIKLHIVTNQIEKLNDFETWKTKQTCTGYMHMMTGFCLMVVPFIHYYNARYVILGNQQDMNFAFKNKDGFLTYPSPDQHTDWIQHQSSMINLISGGAKVISLIEPLTNLSITKILHTRYSEFGEYEISCDSLDASSQLRWCHSCSKCARLFLFMKAFGIKTEKVGFHTDLLEKKQKKLYTLFSRKEVDHYEKSPEARDEQLLAFYMAYKRGIKEPLIDKFKVKYLKRVNYRQLYKKFFSIYQSELPLALKDRVLKIYKQELKNPNSFLPQSHGEHGGYEEIIE